MKYPARSILAIDVSPFGRSLALLPAMRALRTSYSKTLLVAAAATGTGELLKACGLVDETIDVGVIKSQAGGSSGTLKRLLGLAGRSRRYDFDLVLDFSPRLETQIVSRLLLRAPTITPSKLPRAIEVLMDLGRVPRRAGGATSDYDNVLKQADVTFNDTRFLITPSVEEDTRFERRLASSGSRGGELLVLLYASDPRSRQGWPVISFGEIAARLANNFNARIIAADEPSDSTFTEALSSLLPEGTIELAEPRSLELIAAIARASVVVTDERAIAQVASELGTPAIEIADPVTTSGVSSKTHRVVQGSSRVYVLTDEVYEIACEMIQDSRSDSLFRRP